MQLRTQTDYAIRILLYLSQQSEFSANRPMSEALGIAPNYLPKIMRRLREAGWIDSSAGSAGGYRLAKRPDRISLLDIMLLMEDTVKINRCLEPDGYCSRNAGPNCPVHQIYQTYQDFSEQYFSHVAIADLNQPDAINRFYHKLLAQIRGDLLQWDRDGHVFAQL